DRVATHAATIAPASHRRPRRVPCERMECAHRFPLLKALRAAQEFSRVYRCHRRVPRHPERSPNEEQAEATGTREDTFCGRLQAFYGRMIDTRPFWSNCTYRVTP